MISHRVAAVPPGHHEDSSMPTTTNAHGGARTGAGRPPASPGLQRRAAQHAAVAVAALAEVAADPKAPAEARVGAAVALLDAARPPVKG